MKTLTTSWQRLIFNGQTCPCCAGTGNEVEWAYRQFWAQFPPLGIEPMLEIREIDEATYKSDPSASNRLWIAGQTREKWRNASAGSSPCSSVPGASERRTMDAGGTSDEVVPETLPVKAGLIAALTLNARQAQ